MSVNYGKQEIYALLESRGIAYEALEHEAVYTIYLGVAQGCVSPFGVLNDESCSVTVIFDQSLQLSKVVGIHPNDNTASVWMDLGSLRRVIEEHGNPVKIVKFE